MKELKREDIQRYSRNILLPEVGLEGQQKLLDSSVLIIGAGGLGSPASLYLAAAGVGKIGLVDYDIVDETNLQRQILHGESMLGEKKTESAKKRLLDLNPELDLILYDDLFTSENALKIARGYDLIVDGTDNFSTRYLVNDVCVLLSIPNVYGSVFRFEGQVSVFDAKDGPCYRCVFPQPPPASLITSCSAGGVLGVIPGMIGTLQATEAIKLLIGVGTSLKNKMLFYNALDMRFDEINLQKNQNCAICGEKPTITDLVDYQDHCGVAAFNPEQKLAGADWDIYPEELQSKINSGEDIVIVDVREFNERVISKIKNSAVIPLGLLAARVAEIDKDKEIVIYCRSGVRSIRALEILLNAGFIRIKNLVGGINAWVKEIDPTQPLY